MDEVETIRSRVCLPPYRIHQKKKCCLLLSLFLPNAPGAPYGARRGPARSGTPCRSGGTCQIYEKNEHGWAGDPSIDSAQKDPHNIVQARHGHALGQEEQALVVAENAALGEERVLVLAFERGGDAGLVPVCGWRGVVWC